MKRVTSFIVLLSLFAAFMSACGSTPESSDAWISDDGSSFISKSFSDGAVIEIEVTSDNYGSATYTAGGRSTSEEYSRMLGILMFLGDTDIEDFIVTVDGFEETGKIVYVGGEIDLDSTVMPNYNPNDIDGDIAASIKSDLQGAYLKIN